MRQRHRGRMFAVRRFTRVEPFDGLTEEEVFQKYRFHQPVIMVLLGKIRDRLQASTSRSQAYPPLLQLLCTLRFLACGAFFGVIADSLCMSTSRVATFSHRVVDAIVDTMRETFIKWPEDPKEEKRRFHKIAGKLDPLSSLLTN